MTKTLTEQMKTEHGAWYYVKTKEWGICHWLLFPDTLDIEKDIIEVLAPVPSYDKVKEMSQKIERLEFDNEVLDNELKELATKNDTLAMENGRLQERLAIATKALSDIEDGYSESTGAGQIARQALKEMEGVK